MISIIGNNRKAFTLIEVMISAAILSLISLLIYEALFLSLGTFNYCYDYLNVFSLAGEKIWQAQDDLARSGSLTNIGNKGGFASRNKNFLWNLSESPVMESPYQKLYRIDLVLSWREGSKQASISRTAFAIYDKRQTYTVIS